MIPDNIIIFDILALDHNVPRTPPLATNTIYFFSMLHSVPHPLTAHSQHGMITHAMIYDAHTLVSMVGCAL